MEQQLETTEKTIRLPENIRKKAVQIIAEALMKMEMEKIERERAVGE